MSEKDKRVKLILETFSGKTFGNKDVEKCISDAGMTFSSRSLTRDLKELTDAGKIKKLSHVMYKIEIDQMS
ncbi:MAG: hypothetical protein JW995_15825 [Melioribacteraceae bacterium]|nr:hypothetical protein [Melioribacteraceae bacterium]